MGKIYTALGLMSGTSMDGVDASIIRSDGHSKFHKSIDEYCEFDPDLTKKLINLRNRVLLRDDLINLAEELKTLEREITIFHSKLVGQIISKYNKKTEDDIDIIGFHGQTIFHNAKNKITKQLGDGNLLSQLTKKNVVYDFRQNDIKNGGQGAPLTPVFHNLLANLIYNENKNKFFNILNIGGISNLTRTIKQNDFLKKEIEAFDIGPGNCLIDEWVKKNSRKKFDEDGLIGRSGKINELILNQTIENFRFDTYDKSLDIKDFDISFVKGLSLEDGCATLTKFTAYLIAEGIKFCNKKDKNNSNKYLVCGGGRKNIFLIETINLYLKGFNITLEPIDLYNYDGDYVESQAFGYLAIRSYLGLPISFPSTTRCKNPTTGGVLIKNF